MCFSPQRKIAKSLTVVFLFHLFLFCCPCRLQHTSSRKAAKAKVHAYDGVPRSKSDGDEASSIASGTGSNASGLGGGSVKHIASAPAAFIASSDGRSGTAIDATESTTDDVDDGAGAAATADFDEPETPVVSDDMDKDDNTVRSGPHLHAHHCPPTSHLLLFKHARRCAWVHSSHSIAHMVRTVLVRSIH